MLQKLQELSDDPIRVGLVGAGAMGKGIAWQVSHTPGMRLTFIGDLNLEAASETARQIGLNPVETDGDTIPDVSDKDVLVTTNSLGLLRQNDKLGMRAFAEATNAIAAACDYCLSAIAGGMHVILMNAEVDLVYGPLLQREAEKHNVIVTSDAALARKLDAIAFPGMTANFDAGRVAALAMTMLDWREHGEAYARAMVALATELAEALAGEGLPVHARERGCTASHQFAIEAAGFGGGQAASRKLRRAGFLACGIGLPVDPVEGDMNGLRIGTPELCRIGVSESDVPRMASLLQRALSASQPEHLADEVADWRASFNRLHFILA